MVSRLVGRVHAVAKLRDFRIAVAVQQGGEVHGQGHGVMFSAGFSAVTGLSSDG